MKENKVCSICGNEFKGFGNNPYPFDRDICCDECNKNVVIPLRIMLSKMNKKSLVILSTDNSITFYKVDAEKVGLETLQRFVDGYIEFYPNENSDFAYIVNEEGLIRSMEYNYLANELLGIDVVGNVVICPNDLLE